MLVQNGIDVLDTRTEHVARVVHLPFHHRDPFDRLLIAQAKVEGVHIVGADSAMNLSSLRLRLGISGDASRHCSGIFAKSLKNI
jgi:PIN domain nuclease of toxin-antitoxin system